MPIASAAIIGGASILGGVMASGAASDAADAQVAASQQASATQLKMFEEARADQAPWLQRGNEAGNLLNYYLGLPGAGGSGSGLSSDGFDLSQFGVGPAPTLAQYTTTTPGTAGTWGGGQRYTDYSGAWITPPSWQPGTAGSSSVDQVGFQKALADWTAKRDAAMTQMRSDPRFGSLLRQFTGANLASDPGYQFGLHQGENAVTDKHAALGSLLSGATLKDLTQFGNDYGGTKFNEAFQRDMANKQLTYNQLAGVSGTGQVSAGNIGQQTMATGSQLASNLIGEGNARASSYVGGANAINAGISSAGNQMMSGMFLRDYLNNNFTNSGGVGNSTGEMITRGGGNNEYV